MTDAVRAAFAHAAEESAEYLSGCLRTRSTERTGSWYEGHTPATLHAALLAASWEEYSHEAIKSPARGYRAPLGGKLGMVALADLPDEAVVVLLDPKGAECHWTGERCVSPAISASTYKVEATSVDFTTLLVGPASRDESAPMTVWTFHPGAPVAPSQAPRMQGGEFDRHGQTLTVKQAREAGFDFAKLIP